MMRKITKFALLAATSMLMVAPAQADELKDALAADLPSLMEIWTETN